MLVHNEMVLRIFAILLSFSTLLCNVSAQFGPDDRWLKPDGSQVDFTSTYNSGDTMTLSWKALNSSKSDLWLTHWDPTTYPWHYQVASNVDIAIANTLQWYIDVPASTIATDNRFVLRFYPSGAAYGVLQFQQLASPGFFLTGGTTSTSTGGPSQTAGTGTSASASSATSSVATNTATSNTAQLSTSSHSSSTTVITTTDATGGVVTATVTTSVPSSTEVAPSSQTGSSSGSSSNLSVAAQAAIGVAGGLFVILLFIAGCFFGRRHGIGRTLRRNPYGLEREGFPMHQSNSDEFAVRGSRVVEAPVGKSAGRQHTSNETESAALISNRMKDEEHSRWYQGSNPWAEITGNYNHPVEKDGSMVRPGVHEIG